MEEARLKSPSVARNREADPRRVAAASAAARRRARNRQRLGRTRGFLCGKFAASRLLAFRSRRHGASQHRGLAAIARSRQSSCAIGARCARGRLAPPRSRRNPLHQHAPHCALVGDGRLVQRRSENPPEQCAALIMAPIGTRALRRAPSNIEFEAWLKTKDPAFGLRDLEAVADCASRNGFWDPAVIEMPANNLSVIFRRA